LRAGRQGSALTATNARRIPVPRIIVVAESSSQSPPETLLDERVDSSGLCEEDRAERLIERLGWALTDAEEEERDAA
jgi:hypothetical protein